MTKASHLLLAAESLPPQFTVEDLIVAAWKRAPLEFGIHDYAEEYPDSNRVLVKLSGTNGMVERGQFRRKDGLLSLTPEGRKQIAKIKAKAALNEPKTRAK